jgi:hypothetical protein
MTENALVQCPYCLGVFRPGKSGPVREQCCGGCRHDTAAALRAPETGWESTRHESYSRERARATGWGLLTAHEHYQADLRVRFAAGLPVDETPAFLPGGDADMWPRAVMRPTLTTRRQPASARPCAVPPC